MPRRKERRLAFIAPYLNGTNLRRALSAAGWTTAGIVALVGVLWGVPSLRQHAESVERQTIGASPATAIDVRFRHLPDWMAGPELKRLQLIVAESVGPTTLDRDGLVVARDALLRTGWFESVQQIRRRSAELVEVDAIFTEPFALIRDHAGDHLVDPEGRLLPVTWPHGSGSVLPVILRPSGDRPRHFGDAWPGADVSAALQVLKLIDNRDWRHQVVAIDVGGRGRTDLLRLLTCRHSSIRWGRPPGAEGSVEPTFAAKIAFLDHHHARYGHIDGGVDGELDISSDVAVVR